MRIVLTHAEMGVYLGSFLGLGFWSELDCGGQTSAVTFENEADARDYVSTWEHGNDPDAYGYVSCCENTYAEISDLEAAGLNADALKQELLREMRVEGSS